MAEANTNESTVDGGSQESIESLKERLAEMESTIGTLNAEATKNKHLRRQAEKERDELKTKSKQVDKADEDYKALWQQANEKLTKAQERMKSADVKSALSAQLAKAKVSEDKLTAAMDLVDRALIEWDEEAGVDSGSVTAAVQKLKSKYGFLFESTVNPTDVKKAGDGGETRTMSRAAFDALSPMEKVAKVKAGVKLTD